MLRVGFHEFALPDFHWLSRQLVSGIGPWDECLLWATGYGIWDENVQQCYRFRQSYGDMRLVREAPGHLFLQHESADLQSFLQIGMLNGWDMHVATSHNQAQLFVSHDGWAVLWDEERRGTFEELSRVLAEREGGEKSAKSISSSPRRRHS